MTYPCQDETPFSDELLLIPRWAMFAAVLAFALVEYYSWIVVPTHSHHPARLPFVLRFYLLLSWGALAALSMLIIGYISIDAPRRGMSAPLWMICVLIPGGVGTAFYFVLRQPILGSCPSCGAHIEGNHHYCPQCACQVSACCGSCYRGARVTDIFCVYCGHELRGFTRVCFETTPSASAAANRIRAHGSSAADSTSTDRSPWRN